MSQGPGQGYLVRDAPLPGQVGASPPARFVDVHSAIDEAYRRSFAWDCLVIEVYGPAGDFIGRCLDGKWASAKSLKGVGNTWQLR